jgi:molybdopterin-guanine dinucleotide biosynthesis protein A
MKYQGLPLYRYAVRNLRDCCDRVVINTHRDHEAFQQAGFFTVDDGHFAGQGPVAGIHAALARASTPFVAIAACDQLTLPAEVYQTLCAHVGDTHGAYACSAIDQVPTCAVLPVSLAAAARVSLESGQRALMTFMQEFARPVCFEQVDFANLNHQHQVLPE